MCYQQSRRDRGDFGCLCFTDCLDELGMLLRLPLKKNKSFFLFSIYPLVALILFHLRRHTCHFAPIFTAPCCSSVAAAAASCEAPISSEVHLGWPRAELVGLRALGSKARGLTADDHLAGDLWCDYREPSCLIAIVCERGECFTHSAVAAASRSHVQPCSSSTPVAAFDALLPVAPGDTLDMALRSRYI